MIMAMTTTTTSKTGMMMPISAPVLRPCDFAFCTGSKIRRKKKTKQFPYIPLWLSTYLPEQFFG